MDLPVDRERFGAGGVPPWVRREHEARWRFAAQYVSGRRVADCACGVGEGSAVFAAAGAAVVHAFDVSADAVATAAARCAPLPNVQVAEGSITEVPLPDASIDVFVCLETIEHVEDDDAVVRELARVVADDGVVICSTPNRDVTMPGRSLTDRPWNPFHVREYSEAEFVAMLRARFDDVELFGQNARSTIRVRTLGRLGGVLPGNLGGRLTSVVKVPRLAFDRDAHHRVRERASAGSFEYLVAVCRGPRRAT